MKNGAANNIPYLDGWRGLAIAALLVGHFFPIPGINMGAVGVELFFVLSGLLMGQILFVRPVPLGRFYRRRISRVFPSLFAFLATIIVIFLVTGRKVDWSESLTAATFLNNYFPGPPGAAVMPFGHIWSLSVEEHSYVVLSLVALAVRAHVVRAVVAVGLLAVACGLTGLFYWLTYTGVRLNSERWLRTEVSAYGIFVSTFVLLWLEGKPLRRHSGILFVALGAIGLATHWWSVPRPVSTIVGVGAFAVALNLMSGAPGWLHAALSWRPLRQLGLWSFSLYLWQQPFYLYLHDRPLLGVALALPAGVAGFYLLERPARAWLNRHWGGSPQGRPAPGTSGSPSYAPVAGVPAAAGTVPELANLYAAPALDETPALECTGAEPK